jgi:hypothetical protein
MMNRICTISDAITNRFKSHKYHFFYDPKFRVFSSIYYIGSNRLELKHFRRFEEIKREWKVGG